MRRFDFRLEKLLELRRYEERQWEQQLARVTGECALLKNGIQLNRERIRRGGRLPGERGGSLTTTQLIAGDLYIQRLYQEITVWQEQLTAKEKERTEVAQEYLQHSRRRKILEKLKEKRAAEYYKEQRREEFKETDDINNSARTRAELRGAAGE